jgi:CHAT domain-containing protein
VSYRRIGLVVVFSVALASVWLGRSGWPGHAPSTALGVLVEASRTTRFFEPRVTGGFHYTLSSQLRGKPRESAHATEIEIAVAEAERAVRNRRSASNLSTLAKTLLIKGDHDLAIDRLEEAVRVLPSGAAQSDLAAAYFVRSSVTGDQLDAVRALDASLKSIRLDARLPEARFNLGLTLEANHLRDASRKAWVSYLALDSDSAWAAEARTHTGAEAPHREWASLRDELVQENSKSPSAMLTAAEEYPQNVRELVEDELLPRWARMEALRPGAGCAVFDRSMDLARSLSDAGRDEMLYDLLTTIARGRRCPPSTARLTQALLGYAEARGHIARSSYQVAVTALTSAWRKLQRARCSLSYWALANLAYAQYQTRDLTAALVSARQTERFARARGYHALLGRSLWLQALTVRRQGYTDDALRLTADAIAEYERVHEAAAAGAVASTAADMARTSGEEETSWRLMARAIATIDREASPIRRYLCFYNAALFARHDGLLDAALAFQGEAVKSSRAVRDRGMPAQAFGQLAYLEMLLGQRQSARDDLTKARAELAAFHGTTRAYLGAELDTIQAATILNENAAGAQQLLRNAAAVFELTAPEQAADAQLAVGRAARALGHTDEAAEAFEKGIASFEALRQRIAEEDLRIAYFGTARDLYDEMIKLRIDEGDIRSAFIFSDRVRARALLDLLHESRQVWQTPTESGIREAIGARAALVEFRQQGDELLAWIVTQRIFELVRIPLPKNRLRTLVDTLRASSDSAAAAKASTEIYDTVIRPIRLKIGATETLYISPDDVLHGTPLAALYDRRTNRYLAEDYVTVIVPSAAWLTAQASREGPREHEASHLLAVGNPSFDRRSNPGLLPLPSAEREAESIAGMYDRSSLLSGASATREEIMRRLPHAQVLHFAGHAVENDVAPARSYLLLSPSATGDDGRLHADEIAQLPLHGTRLVVLGACSTASGRVRFGEGPLNMARPFLAAGVRAVVASLWDIDDTQARRFMTQMHAKLLDGRSSAKAVQLAQTTLIHSDNAADRDPRHWGAFVSIGSVVAHSSAR